MQSSSIKVDNHIMGGLINVNEVDCNPPNAVELNEFFRTMKRLCGDKSIALEDDFWTQLRFLCVDAHSDWEQTLLASCEDFLYNNPQTGHYCRLIQHTITSLRDIILSPSPAIDVTELRRVMNLLCLIQHFTKYFIEQCAPSQLGSILSPMPSDRQIIIDFYRTLIEITKHVLPTLLHQRSGPHHAPSMRNQSQTAPLQHQEAFGILIEDLYLEIIHLFIVFASSQLLVDPDSEPLAIDPQDEESPHFLLKLLLELPVSDLSNLCDALLSILTFHGRSISIESTNSFATDTRDLYDTLSVSHSPAEPLDSTADHVLSADALSTVLSEQTSVDPAEFLLDIDTESQLESASRSDAVSKMENESNDNDIGIEPDNDHVDGLRASLIGTIGRNLYGLMWSSGRDGTDSRKQSSEQLKEQCALLLILLSHQKWYGFYGFHFML